MTDPIENAVPEPRRYRRADGNAIVDVSPKLAYRWIPRDVRVVGSGASVHVVRGTSDYTRTAHPDHVDLSSVEELADEFESDVKEDRQ